MKTIAGQKFGMLTVVQFSHINNGGYYWLCRCDCGTVKPMPISNLKRGDTKSCGCNRTKVNITHGLTHHKIYGVYVNMIERCYNSKNKSFKHYGGRGISVCDDWKNDNTKFFSWAFASGWQESLQLDRIDNEGNYSPENCRFITHKVNVNNRRNNRLLTYKGQAKTFTEWAEISGVSRKLIEYRLNQGMSAEEAITKPVKQFNK